MRSHVPCLRPTAFPQSSGQARGPPPPMSKGLCSRRPRYDAVVRLLMPSGRAWLLRASPAGPGPLVAAAGGMRPPRFRTKDVSTRMGSPTAPGPSHTSPFIAWDDVAFSMAERDRHLGNASFAAQYPAHGLPCERFTSALASCRADSGPERPARPYSAVDFHLLSFASLSWHSPLLAEVICPPRLVTQHESPGC